MRSLISYLNFLTSYISICHDLTKKNWHSSWYFQHPPTFVAPSLLTIKHDYEGLIVSFVKFAFCFSTVKNSICPRSNVWNESYTDINYHYPTQITLLIKKKKKHKNIWKVKYNVSEQIKIRKIHTWKLCLSLGL